MTRKGNAIIGYVTLAVVAIALIAIPKISSFVCSLTACPATSTPIPTSTPRPAPTATVTPIAYSSVYVYGGYRYFEDQEILAILHDQYHIDVTGEFRKGTFAMADDYDAGKKQVDCIFPGSQIGIDYFKLQHPKVIRNSVVAAQDRIVVFTWAEMLPALEKADLIYNKDGIWYLRMKPLVDAMIDEKQWQDVGADIPGYVRVESTDPLKSSSGLQWMAFLGSYLVPGNETGGRLLTMDDLQTDPTIIQRLYTYWENQGAQVETTGKLFPKFITSGAGIPMIVAYESSFTDWYSSLPDAQKSLAKKIVGVYPETTINIEHSLASLTPACDPLLDPVTKDPKIQQLAWENHGLHPQGWIPEPPPSAPWLAITIPYVPEPKKDVTDAIQAALK